MKITLMDLINVTADVKTQMNGRMSNKKPKTRNNKNVTANVKISYVQIALEHWKAGIRKEIISALKSVHLNSS